jgi:hypothetical protein
MYRYLLPLLLLTMVACSTPTSTSTTTAPASAPTPAASYAGTWALSIQNTPAGTITGDLQLSETSGELSGKLLTGGSEIDVPTVERTSDGLRLEFYSNDYQMDVVIRLTGEPDADSLTGQTLGQYQTVATRK